MDRRVISFLWSCGGWVHTCLSLQQKVHVMTWLNLVYQTLIHLFILIFHAPVYTCYSALLCHLFVHVFFDDCILYLDILFIWKYLWPHLSCHSFHGWRKKIFNITNLCRDFFFYLQQVALENGLLLVHTKYEFGKDVDGTITLIDEVWYPILCTFSFPLLFVFFLSFSL